MDDLDRPIPQTPTREPEVNPTGPNRRGRQHGSRTLATAEMRMRLTGMVVQQLDKLPRWLDRVARTRPDLAASLLLHATEFVLPKLQRTEYVGEVVVSTDPDQERRELEAQLRQLGVDPSELLMQAMLKHRAHDDARTIEHQADEQ